MVYAKFKMAVKMVYKHKAICIRWIIFRIINERLQKRFIFKNRALKSSKLEDFRSLKCSKLEDIRALKSSNLAVGV